MGRAAAGGRRPAEPRKTIAGSNQMDAAQARKLEDMTNLATGDSPECWPATAARFLRETCATLHMWTRLWARCDAADAAVNHWWNVPLYVTPRGLRRRYSYGTRSIEFVSIFLAVGWCWSQRWTGEELPLRPMTVADFYRDFMAMLKSAASEVSIWRMPSRSRSHPLRRGPRARGVRASG